VLEASPWQFGIRGFIRRYEFSERDGRFGAYTQSGTGRAGHENLGGEGDSWQTGGAPVWVRVPMHSSPFNLMGTGTPVGLELLTHGPEIISTAIP